MASDLSSSVAFESLEISTGRSCKIFVADASGAELLTAREMEIMELFGTGLSVKGAARELAISPGTVKWHVKNIYYKLGASSREDALFKARQRKIL
jgi:DNA-binding NarL/FixJ family response regulator